MSFSAGQRRTFGITWIAYAGFYLCRKNLSVVLPLLNNVSGLRSIDLANIVFGYSLLYAVGQFGCGFFPTALEQSVWLAPACCWW